MKGAVYNENDPAAAAWLRELIKNNLIAPGDVDERSIKDVSADDYRHYVQCHFFAGIGVWSAALRKAGWPDERPITTGSCPCQPFSAAGKGLGFDDPRHLWPDWLRIIDEALEQGQPWASTLLGEQVASAGVWLDLVQADLEDRRFAFAAADLPAAGFANGAHIRQRIYWVADRHDAQRWSDLAGRDFSHWPQAGRVESNRQPGAGGAAGGLDLGLGVGRGARGEDDPEHDGLVAAAASSHSGRLDFAPGGGRERLGDEPAHHEPLQAGAAAGPGGLGDHHHQRLAERQERDGGALGGPAGQAPCGSDPGGSDVVGGLGVAEGLQHNGCWDARGGWGKPADDGDLHGLGHNSGARSPLGSWGPDERGAIRLQGTAPGATGSLLGCDWLFCHDARIRPVEAGTFPLAASTPGRVGLLRGYGNALDLETAANFVAAYMEAEGIASTMADLT